MYLFFNYFIKQKNTFCIHWSFYLFIDLVIYLHYLIIFIYIIYIIITNMYLFKNVLIYYIPTI